jgi:hypothetical protein
MKMRNRVKIPLIFFAIPLVFFMLNHAIGQHDHEYPPDKKNNVLASGSGGLTDGTKEHRMVAEQIIEKEEQIIRQPMQSGYASREVDSREPKAIKEIDFDTGTYRLILIESEKEYIADTFILGKEDIPSGIAARFDFGDYYAMGDTIYYIYSRYQKIYLGASVRQSDGTFLRKGEGLFISGGLESHRIPRKRFIAPSDGISLRVEIGNVVDHKIYELNESKEFVLKEAKLDPEFSK